MKLPSLHFAILPDTDGRKHSLALVATHWKDEGSAVYEMTDAAGKAAIAIEYGTWRVTGSDDGPSVLSLELPDSAEYYPTIVNQLLSALTKGAAGVADTYESVT